MAPEMTLEEKVVKGTPEEKVEVTPAGILN